LTDTILIPQTKKWLNATENQKMCLRVKLVLAIRIRIAQLPLMDITSQLLI
jgi:hypothetical protein